MYRLLKISSIGIAGLYIGTIIVKFLLLINTYILICPATRGKGITSLILATPVTYITSLSKPIPKPLDGA
ncbi:Uncharacterised protein [Chlamydia trachomatis]|nr:Uncharacterised protein [Chlamydia trachomatis]